MQLQTYYKVEINKSVEEISYDGESSGDLTCYGTIEVQTFKTIQEIVDYLTDAYGTPDIFDDRLIIQLMEDKYGRQVDYNSTKFEKYKNGEIMLYSVCYESTILKVRETRFEYEELKENFKNLKEV